MKVEQIYTGCLAQGAYYIVSNGEAAIIDPLRESQPYLDRLIADGVKLKYIFETHFHADFVSGHIDLARHTGAQIVFGPTAETKYDSVIAEDNQEFKIGDLTIKVLHTPGHTMECVVYLLKDESSKDYCIFTGDTLFLGDVGRPDLAQKSANMTQEDLAGMLYDSLMTKIIPLADDVIVYPAHGAGSACGKNMMKETVDTLGNQKKMNYALNQPNKEAFISALLDGLASPPGYFGANVAMNKTGYESFETIKKNGLNPLSAGEFELMIESNKALVLDTRLAGDFCKGFIPHAMNIGLKGDFAPWVGSVIEDIKTPILLVCETGTEEEAITRLSRVGFDNVLGYLNGGFDTWTSSGKSIDQIKRITAEEFANECKVGESKVLDVRKTGEFDASHVTRADFKSLNEIKNWKQELNPSQHYYIYCGGGYRSMIAASILKSKGICQISEVEGGYNAIKKTNIERKESTCGN